MVGSLKYLGEEKWSLKQFKNVLSSKDRTKCAPPAPACGLYLDKCKILETNYKTLLSAGKTLSHLNFLIVFKDLLKRYSAKLFFFFNFKIILIISSSFL